MTISNHNTVEDTKQCKLCREIKPFSEYYRNRSTGYYQSDCKTCMRASFAVYRNQPHIREARRKQALEYYHRPDIHQRTHGYRLRTKYGLSSGEYTNLLALQGGKCAICNTETPSAKDKRMHVDHNHRTGTVRGLLCGNCNNGLGRFKDNPEFLMSAAVYLTPKIEVLRAA